MGSRRPNHLCSSSGSADAILPWPPPAQSYLRLPMSVVCPAAPREGTCLGSEAPDEASMTSATARFQALAAVACHKSSCRLHSIARLQNTTDARRM